jgi:23S rRNA U2552 (ribose-2'-O)-methylase RlmE/FtsJ
LSVQTLTNYEQLTGHHISDCLSNFRHRRTETVSGNIFMRNLGDFVIKVYQTSRAQQFSALERNRNLPNLGSYLIVT